MSLAARVRVATAYRWRHGRWPALNRPQLFTEWVQWRKLFDRDVGLARLTDKAHAKRVATSVLPEEFLIPTVWQGMLLPEHPPAPLPLIVKANHGCNQFTVVRTADDWEKARAISPHWLNHAYGRWLDEWHYELADRSLIVEPFISETDALPTDYKFYVFGGRVVMVQVHQGRGADHRWSQLTTEWRPLSANAFEQAPPPSLDAMIDAASRLAGGQDFLRVDFYDIGGQAIFGEFCLFPGSGLDPFRPLSLDRMLGDLWSAQHPQVSAAAAGPCAVDPVPEVAAALPTAR
ncbi:ATP-grasp fold amidoligase family protein [Sphingomonas sp. LY160]|nr:ATP-grasp fold amidoligase family protein [Sphingomonas sp. LY160]MEA1071044.1 ATP-grasp fold amidoligase family protein [Sphingomonas sp. LY160]